MQGRRSFCGACGAGLFFTNAPLQRMGVTQCESLRSTAPTRLRRKRRRRWPSGSDGWTPPTRCRRSSASRLPAEPRHEVGEAQERGPVAVLTEIERDVDWRSDLRRGDFTDGLRPRGSLGRCDWKDRARRCRNAAGLGGCSHATSRDAREARPSTVRRRPSSLANSKRR